MLKVEKQLTKRKFKEGPELIASTKSITASLTDSENTSCRGMSKNQKACHKLEKAKNQALQFMNSLKRTLEIANKPNTEEREEEEKKGNEEKF